MNMVYMSETVWFQLGHFFSEMDSSKDTREFKIAFTMFQLGHFFSEMDMNVLKAVWGAGKRFNWATAFRTWVVHPSGPDGPVLQGACLPEYFFA